jgi:hypothetical protein
MMTAAIFTDAKFSEAACDTCVTFGMAKFDGMKKLAEELSSYFDGGFPALAQVLTLLKSTRLHFEGGVYSTHCQDCSSVGSGSVCAMHCHAYALSDPGDAAFADDCPHEHDMECVSCNLIHYLQSDIEFMALRLLEDTRITSGEHKEFTEDIDMLFGDRGSERYVSHFMRDTRSKLYAKVCELVLPHNCTSADPLPPPPNTHSTNQPTNRPTNQPTNQPTNPLHG